MIYKFGQIKINAVKSSKKETITKNVKNNLETYEMAQLKLKTSSITRLVAHPRKNSRELFCNTLRICLTFYPSSW